MEESKKTRILVVDDEKEFTDLIQMHLRRRGNVHLRIVNESESALEAARQFRPDVILLDIVMPNMDGGDILAKLEVDGQLKHIPVILVSALVSNEETSDTKLTMRDGHAVVAKPVKMERLLNCIEQVVGHKVDEH